MKIGLDLRLLGNRHGGIGRYAFEIARHILEIDHANEYAAFINFKDVDERDIVALRQFKNLTIVPANSRHYSFAEQTKFLYLLNKQNLDLAHFMNFNVPIFYKKPYVVTIHDVVHHKLGGSKKTHLLHFYAYKKVIENAANRSLKIITVSEHSKKDITQTLQVAPEKVCVIYEGTALNSKIDDYLVAEAKRKFWLQRPYFLFVGVLERKKNVVSLTRGMDVFVKKYSKDYDMVIVGKIDQHYPEVRHKAMDIANKGHLVFAGYVDDEELRGLYGGAHAFVSASLHEGFGLPGVEAMKFGLPLGVSNVDVFNEIYDNAAVYFNPLDPDDIADKLNLLTRDQQFYEQLKRNSLERSKLFDWSRAAKQTVAVYNSILNSRSKLGLPADGEIEKIPPELLRGDIGDNNGDDLL